MQSVVKSLTLALSVSLGLALSVPAFAEPDATCRPDVEAAASHGFSRLLGGSLANLDLDAEQRKGVEAVEHGLRSHESTAARASEELLLALTGQFPSGHIELRPVERELASYVAAEAAYREALRAALAQVHALLTPAQRNTFADHLTKSVAGRASLYDRPSWLDAWANQVSLSEAQKQKVREILERQHPKAEVTQFEQALASFARDDFALSRSVPKQQDAVLSLASALRTIQTTNEIVALLNPEQREAAVKSLHNRICQPSRDLGYGYAFPYAGGFGALR